MYKLFFRQIRHKAMVSAWLYSKTDYRNWDDERYPPPPIMSHPSSIILKGRWADLFISKDNNYYSSARQLIIEDDNKIKRLYKRRIARKYCAAQKRKV